MRRRFSTRTILFGAMLWLVILGCRTSEVVARVNPTATATVTRTVPRPTFTRAAPTLPPTNTAPPAKPGATRTATLRPVPTRKPTIGPTQPPPPPTSTPDPYAGFLYKPGKLTCITARNTRIQGTVYTGGTKQNNVFVRVTSSEEGPPAIDDALTGTDPSDIKHINPALQGQYRLGLYEGRQRGGTWFVYVLGANKEPISPKVRVVTSEGPGDNTCTVDFAH